jgi:hypothetical protein
VLATSDLDGNGRDEVMLNFTGYRVWIWKNDAAFDQLHPSDVEAIAAGRFDSNEWPVSAEAASGRMARRRRLFRPAAWRGVLRGGHPFNARPSVTRRRAVNPSMAVPAKCPTLRDFSPVQVPTLRVEKLAER